MRRIKNLDLIPDYLKDKKYDVLHKKYSERKLSLEIHERQTIYTQIMGFENFHSSEQPDDYKIFTGIELNLIYKKHIDKSISKADLTVKEYIEIDREFYSEKLEKISKNFTNPKEESAHINDTTNTINNRKWDMRPYITPVTNKNSYLQKKFDLSFTSFREQFMQPEDQTSLLLNLDFSDNTILENVQQHLKFLRAQHKHRPIFAKSKDLIYKIKTYKILQVIDIYLWQKLNNYHIEYQALENLLYKNAIFENDHLKDTIIPLAKCLLDSKSKDSLYLFYLADQNFKNKVGKVLT